MNNDFNLNKIKNDELNRIISDQETKINNLEVYNQALLNSLSWRVTFPLRWVFKMPNIFLSYVKSVFLLFIQSNFFRIIYQHLSKYGNSKFVKRTFKLMPFLYKFSLLVHLDSKNQIGNDTEKTYLITSNTSRRSIEILELFGENKENGQEVL